MYNLLPIFIKFMLYYIYINEIFCRTIYALVCNRMLKDIYSRLHVYIDLDLHIELHAAVHNILMLYIYYI